MGLRSAWQTFSDYYDLKNGSGDLIFVSALLSLIGGALGMGGGIVALTLAEDDATYGQSVASAQVARYDRDLSVIKSFKENSKKLEGDMGAALATQNATGLPEADRAKAGDAYKSLMSSWTSQQDQATKMTGNLYTRLILDDKISEEQFRTLIRTARDTLPEQPPAVSFIKLRECQVEFATVSLPDDQKAAQVAECSIDKKSFFILEIFRQTIPSRISTGHFNKLTSFFGFFCRR